MSDSYYDEAQRLENEARVLRHMDAHRTAAALEVAATNVKLKAERDALKAKILEILGDYGSVRTERDALKAEVEKWHDEVRRFNAGYARHAEPYANLDDEFEQMGWAWANVDDIAKLKSEVERLRALLSAAHADMVRIHAPPEYRNSSACCCDDCAALRSGIRSVTMNAVRKELEVPESELDEAFRAALRGEEEKP